EGVEGWRARGLVNDEQTAAALPRQRLQALVEGGVQAREIALLPLVQDADGPVRIVEGKDGALVDGGSTTERAGVKGVALDLGGATLVRLDDQADDLVAEDHGGGVELRQARNQVLRPLAVGDDLLLGPPHAAGAQPGEGEGGAHQPEEAAAGDRIGELGGARRELAVDELLELLGLSDVLEATPIG